jgi:integrase
MATITPLFKLKDPKAEKPTLIYLILYYNKQRFVYSTGEFMHPELWNKHTERPYLKNSEEGLTVKMTRIETIQADTINKELAKYIDQTAQIINQLSIEHTIPTNEALKAKYDSIFRPTTPEKKPTTPEKINLNQFIEQFIQDIKSGKRTTEKGTRYSTGTIKNYLGFQSMFNEFQLDPRDRQNSEERKKRKDHKPKEPNYKRKNIDFQDITIDFYDKYVSFFNSMNYSPNTVGRHVKNLKVIIRAAKEEGLTENQDIERKKFKVLTVEVKPIYLTQKEIETLYNLNLSDNKPLDIARDIFLIGCYTGQRFSDYSRINSQHIKEIKGGKIIDLIQKKTGEQVLIPIRPELETILKKYNYNPPRTFDQKLNERIKTVCEKAEINEQIEVEEIKGGLKVTQRKAKHELIKTHTARRTGATLMFLAGIPTISIMKITGHKTEREFLKYIRVTKEETAQTLINHPYFMGTPLKLVK